MAILTALLWSYHNEAIPDEIVFVFIKFLAQWNDDFGISIVFAHVLDEFVQYVFVNMLPHIFVGGRVGVL